MKRYICPYFLKSVITLRSVSSQSLVLALFSCVHRGYVFEVTRASWAKPRSFNGYSFHRIPARKPSKLDQQLPTAPSDRHHLRHSLPHLRTRMIRLLPQRRLDLFKIR